MNVLLMTKISNSHVLSCNLAVIFFSILSMLKTLDIDQLMDDLHTGCKYEDKIFVLGLVMKKLREANKSNR